MSKSHGLTNSSNGQQGSQCQTCRAVERWRRQEKSVLAVTSFAILCSSAGNDKQTGVGSSTSE